MSARTKFNIGLVGAVSFGKTTVVQKLTNVNTKKHSSEMKTGRTVQLGYANALLWKCDSCEGIFCTGQSIQKKTCEYCNSDMEIKFRLSFCDNPGHASYINTMIKGSSVIDAAIVVTDVTQDPAQVQTIEHLAILEALDVRNTIVVQNKCDLVDFKQCQLHKSLLEKQFKNTVAENAPIVPICAQRGMNMDELVIMIYQLCEKLSVQQQKPSKYSGFTIIRSFDVNRPYTDVDHLKGGVVGGCVIGDCKISVGDVLEIRPGLLQKDKTCIPIQTKITNIFSEKESCPTCDLGGLYALGTLLDPSITKSDRMVGCIIGKPEYLPPVVDELKLKIHYVNLEESLQQQQPSSSKITSVSQKLLTTSVSNVSKAIISTVSSVTVCSNVTKAPISNKINGNQDYFFVWGNLMVKGKCVALTKKTFMVKFEKPICPYLSKCIVYSKMNSGKSLQMIGVGIIESGA